ncbi:MAG: DEAD/DEAH box helicase family protein [Okeania sp. SIO2C2]|uniref:DEAD/DEAH box helicase family protein n=1 Tax=Okeania sp. SIO2C2 TaxID=2607787 RepID=UPI0013B7A941|nr:DEAD/DEAH box helicase family protein [Okeania sp. SIO2C2]NEP85428.1 DEAD/DEAH box helicase family protein [Okeania sp. SIO2C2]
MVDFKKKLGVKSIQKKVNPIEIYDQLDRKSETGPLRPVQIEILKEWWLNRKEDQDLIFKLHTGQGKTLIGLLILQSRLNQKKGPCLYVCPNKYLVEQTAQEAEKFGIGYVTIDDSLPDEFLNSEKILITHVQKVFNGKSKFGVGGKFQKVNTVILDDSHACIDSINDSFKIKVNNEHQLYKKLLQLFEDDLREQGEGSLEEIKSKSKEYQDTLLPVPYWSWQDKKSEVIKALLESDNENEVKFAWPLIKDNLENCQCFFSGKELEISTILSPISKFGTFSKAEHRILMSATTQNDSFFVKGFGLNIEAVKNPLIDKNEKWSGEKMILIPWLIHEELKETYIINKFAAKDVNRRVGYVVITSSFKKAETYENLGSTVIKSDNIFKEIEKLKSGEYRNTIVFANRYDGIDLPDNSCRVLIIDSMPYSSSLTERYEEKCRSNSDFLNIKTAQKIEQGLGRSVRGERDYSVIIINGNDLVKFLKSGDSNKFFSEQTRKQINIGIEVSNLAKEEDTNEGTDYTKVLDNLIDQCLSRDEGWKEFYKERMEEESDEEEKVNKNILEILELERKAEESFYQNEPEKAANYVQKIIDSYCANDEAEKAWYLQILARYKYKMSKTESNLTQKGAFNKNWELLKPKERISYKKLNYINENRLKRINTWVSKHKNYEELMLTVEDILGNLSFGEEASKFEKALQDLGSSIGFLSQRPEKEFNTGPDNLWCISQNDYFIFECKSKVEESRKEITKTETGQMNNHCGWFDKEYNAEQVKRILIIPTKDVSHQGNFTHHVEIMRKGKLKLLRDNVKSFFKEFKDYQLDEISDSKIQEWIQIHKLDVEPLKSEYSEDYYQK